MSGPHAPAGAVAIVTAPAGRWAYRGKVGCQNVTCTMDGNPDRCYGWHCGHCDKPSNCQGDCNCQVSGVLRVQVPKACPECGGPSASGRCFECRGRSMVDPGAEE